MEPSDDEIMIVDGSDDMNLVITDVVSLADINESENSKQKRQRLSASGSHTLNTSRSLVVSRLSQVPSPVVISVTSSPAPPHPKSSSDSKRSESATSVKVTSQGAVISQNEPIPCIENCLLGWREIFPWVQYGEDRIFSCSVCKWGFSSSEYFQIYKLEKENGIYCVAAKLRAHAQKKHHISAEKEQAVLLGLCKSLYPVLKYSFPKISGIDDIQKSVYVFLGNIVQNEKLGGNENCIADPLSDLKIEKQSLASLVVKSLASGIQMQFLESLKQSPFFSVISWGCLNSVIVRWLTEDFDVVEHFFASNLSPTGVLPVLAYLQNCGVQMDRMVSYSNIMKNIEPHINSQTSLINVADRSCPLELCIKWLRTVDFFEEYLNHMMVLPKLCRIAFKRQQTPAIVEISNIQDTESLKCVFSVKIVEFALSNYRSLDNAVKNSDLENKEKLNFLKFGSEKLSKPESFCIDALPELYDIIKNYDAWTSINKLHALKETVIFLKNSDTSALTTILENFIDHLSFSLRSQKTTNLLYLNIMIKDLSNLTQREFEYVCKALMTELCNIGYCQIDELRTLLGKKNSTSLLKLLSDLQFQPKYHQRFPELLRLGQKIMTIPALSAHVERYAFDFATAIRLLAGKLPGELIPSFAYILLEGPDSADHINTENILREWCKS